MSYCLIRELAEHEIGVVDALQQLNDLGWSAPVLVDGDD